MKNLFDFANTRNFHIGVKPITQKFYLVQIITHLSHKMSENFLNKNGISTVYSESIKQTKLSLLFPITTFKILLYQDSTFADEMIKRQL